MKNYLLSIFVLAVGISVASAEEKQATADLSAIKATLNIMAPGKAPDHIKPSGLPGVYEIAYGTEVIYMSKDGRYFIRGDIYDMKSMKNLTEEVRTVGRQKLLGELKEENMVVFSPAEDKQKYAVTVFTDIDCGYCRRLHSEISSYLAQGIKVRYAAYPRAGENSSSFNKAVSVWCADDQKDAMTKAKAGQQLEAKECDNPVKKQLDMARKLGLSGTPTIILDDGRIIPGYVNAQKLVEVLAKK